MFHSGRLRCSFCRRGEAEVSKLVAGPGVYICDRCNATVSRIMEDAGDDQGQPPETRSPVWRALLSRALRFLRGIVARRASTTVLADSTW